MWGADCFGPEIFMSASKSMRSLLFLTPHHVMSSRRLLIWVAFIFLNRLTYDRRILFVDHFKHLLSCLGFVLKGLISWLLDHTRVGSCHLRFIANFNLSCSWLRFSSLQHILLLFLCHHHHVLSTVLHKLLPFSLHVDVLWAQFENLVT